MNTKQLLNRHILTEFNKYPSKSQSLNNLNDKKVLACYRQLTLKNRLYWLVTEADKKEKDYLLNGYKLSNGTWQYFESLPFSELSKLFGLERITNLRLSSVFEFINAIDKKT